MPKETLKETPNKFLGKSLDDSQEKNISNFGEIIEVFPGEIPQDIYGKMSD